MARCYFDVQNGKPLVRGGCHINGEYCPVLVKEKSRTEKIKDLGCAKTDVVGQPNGYTQLM